MRFDTKLAIVVRDDLAVWQKLNVTAFLASGLTGAAGGLIGKPYEDASGNRYLEMLVQPVLIYAGSADDLARVRERAAGRGLPTAVYIDEMFATGNDDDNRASVRAVPEEELSLAGAGIYGPRNAVDKVCKGLALHG